MTDHHDVNQVAAATTLTNPTTQTAIASTSAIPFPSTTTDERELKKRLRQAMSYVDTVKAAFQGEPEKYATFLAILKDFQNSLCDTPTTVERIVVLLREHPEAIEGYNVFLPDGYRVQYVDSPGGRRIISVVTPQGTRTI